ncbi:Aspartate ammonia-lyase [Devosia sp. DBB001]|nr:Aspartate ammonia-lyase [Devosia sp. DBB001]
MANTGKIFRSEEDSLGSIDVPAHALWGAQTQRAVENFAISGIRIGQFDTLIVALGMIKKAAARANGKLGALAPEKVAAIEAACNALIAGGHRRAFPIDAIQGGAGTSVNMNVNEVIANLANEKAGQGRGSYGFIHPNDDVNRAQSTNDVYPSAVKLSLVLASKRLEAVLENLAASFEDRAGAFAGVVKLGRTQLQDAVPMTLGQEFGAFATTLRKDVAAIRAAVPALCEINLGGTAVGTGLNAPEGYAAIVIEELAGISGLPVQLAEDMLEASWDMGAFVSLSGLLKRIATKLSKIANDLRLLSSGPRGGIGEIRLPEVQPGSSIMPGKVNPVIPEVVNQVCFQVMGNDVAITMAAEAGQLQLNAMEPLIAFNLHVSLQLLERAIVTFDERCVSGIVADGARCRAHLDASVVTATALVPVIGYRRSARLAKDALTKHRTVSELALEENLIGPNGLALLDPMKLAFPHAGPPAGES